MHPFLTIHSNSALGRGTNRPTPPCHPLRPRVWDFRAWMARSYLRQHQEGGAENCWQHPPPPPPLPQSFPPPLTPQTTIDCFTNVSKGCRSGVPKCPVCVSCHWCCSPHLLPIPLLIHPPLFYHHHTTLPIKSTKLNPKDLKNQGVALRQKSPSLPSLRREKGTRRGGCQRPDMPDRFHDVSKWTSLLLRVKSIQAISAGRPCDNRGIPELSLKQKSKDSARTCWENPGSG